MQILSERNNAPFIDVEAEVSRLALRNEVERAVAIASLGARWVLHPKYKNPGHQVSGSRSSAVLADVMARATKAGRI